MKVLEIYDFIKKKYNLIEEEQAFNTVGLSIVRDVTVLYLDREFNRIYLSDDIFYSKGCRLILTHFSANSESKDDVNSITEKIDLLMMFLHLSYLIKSILQIFI